MNENSVEILLVEDNPNDVELTLDALRELKLANRIQVVRDGAEALDYLFHMNIYANRPNGNPKLILLDLKLPKINGLEVLQRVKAAPTTKLIPVVMLTSSHEESDLVESYKFGASSYIVKPVDFEQFTQSIREIGFYWLLLNQLPRI